MVGVAVVGPGVARFIFDYKVGSEDTRIEVVGVAVVAPSVAQLAFGDRVYKEQGRYSA